MKFTTIAAGLVGCAILGATATASPMADAENARYKAELEAGIRKLNAAHVERLKVIQSSLTAAGDLDGALVIRDQIKAMTDAPTSPDAVAISSVAPTTKPIESTKVENDDISFLKGNWILLSGGMQHAFTFDETGNYQSVAWGSRALKRKIKTIYMATNLGEEKFFKIVDKNTLEGVDKNGNKTGEMIRRKTDLNP